MNKNKLEAKRWSEQAINDMQAAEWSKQGKFYTQCCFLCQQSGEKLLKGYLYGQGERLVLGHSLLELLGKCQPYNQNLQVLDVECRFLDRLYIPTRYPNGLPAGIPQTHYTLADAEQALAALYKISNLIGSLIEGLPD
ncbi:MAG: HEPN domain-containing protein [Planctomycetota bacterium]|nr:HEPN domain-containing protein [Planctomycetota bacterium]